MTKTVTTNIVFNKNDLTVDSIGS